MPKIVFYIITVVLIAAFIILSKTFAPIWLLLLVITMLWSQRQESNIRPVFLLSILLFALYFLFHYFSILVPFIIGFGLAYILAPVVEFLERRKIPRVLAILIILLPILAIFPLLIVLIVSGLISEVQGLIEKMPYGFQYLQTYFGSLMNKLIELGVEIDTRVISNTVTSHLSRIISGLFTTIGQIGKGIGSLVVIIYNLILIPLSTYLFLSDRKHIAAWFKNLFGAQERERIDGFVAKLNVSLARFFRGTLILMFLVGLIVGFSLWILGIRYYLLLAVIAAFFNLIPNIGFILSFIPAIVIGLLMPDPVANTIKIVCVYAGEQLLENLVLGPLIIGKSSGLHPVVVMITLILGGAIFGFWGVILAVPITIFIREFLNYFLNLNL